jgi:hypothetical protein
MIMPAATAKLDKSTLDTSKLDTSTLDASTLIDEKIAALADWRGTTLAHMRKLIHAADPEVVEEVKWRGVPVFSHAGILCTGETYKSVVKLTFASGASLDDPKKLFNSSLDGNVRRAIDIHEGDRHEGDRHEGDRHEGDRHEGDRHEGDRHEGDRIDEAAFKALIRAAVALNLAKLNPAKVNLAKKSKLKAR